MPSPGARAMLALVPAQSRAVLSPNPPPLVSCVLPSLVVLGGMTIPFGAQGRMFPPCWIVLLGNPPPAFQEVLLCAPFHPELLHVSWLLCRGGLLWLTGACPLCRLGTPEDNVFPLLFGNVLLYSLLYTVWWLIPFLTFSSTKI